MYRGGSGKNGEKWQDLGYIWKVGSTRSANKLDVGCERKKSQGWLWGSWPKQGKVEDLPLMLRWGCLMVELGHFLTHWKIWLISNSI